MAQTERRRPIDGDHTEIMAMLGKIQTDQAEIKNELLARKHLDDKVISIDKVVNGNGVPGLRTDVQIIKDQLGRLNWASGLVIAGLLADVLSRILSQ